MVTGRKAEGMMGEINGGRKEGNEETFDDDGRKEGREKERKGWRAPGIKEERRNGLDGDRKGKEGNKEGFGC